MHFDPRTQRALREVGLSTEDIQTAAEIVVEATDETAEAIESFFETHQQVVSDMTMAHSDADHQTHVVEYIDLYTHADDIRGYLRFDDWGVPIEGGRVLEDGKLVELALGSTVNDRVRFALDTDTL
ncbi:hypothetical protein Hrd1104_03685 [Halorhabdus sp. CBA1104]|uniref:DUF7532 family protein n=1 Tax=unclassified Halorhabdus TaxID=2621901 RepID=UPI0012B42EB4|nr:MULTISPECIES: hypothetical protein [unclassified Halorhabdus]QGN06484.1 hypothetical protein Hrd1104_03685 [Halorhabdus sp. CBA1104]